MTNALDITWGLPAPEGTPASWGARAIDDPVTFGLLGDRQSLTGEEPHRTALTAILNDLGALSKAEDEWARLKAAYEVSGDESRKVVLYEDLLIKIEANTNASYGYVYLVAYFKPAGYTNERLRGYAGGPQDNVPEGQMVWSNDVLPEVGETIYATYAGWASETGRMKVLGYAVEHGHLHVVGLLDSPTEKWTRQAADVPSAKPPGFTYWNVMGREFEQFRTEANGYCEVAEQAEVEKIRAIEDSDTRKAAYKRLRDTRKARFAHVTEAYIVLFPNDGKGEDALLGNRQYTTVGTLPVEEAKALVRRSVVGTVWESYQVGSRSGSAIWLAHPGSSDERTWEGDHNDAEAETVLGRF